jgi:signal transduction histidine kinase
VVDNLISNAIKYNKPRGSVDVSLTATFLELNVEDTGVGVSSEDLEKLFTRFYRGNAARAGHIQGTGLGLSIVLAIIHAHEGRIELGGQSSLGLSASVRLPMVRAPL